MSVTYTQLVSAVSSTLIDMGIAYSTSSAPVQQLSPRPRAGSGSKVVATVRELRVDHVGRGAEHANSRSTGVLVFALAPSQATPDVNLGAISALMELGHRFVIKLDGVNEVRASLQHVRATPAAVEFTVGLTFGAVVVSGDTDDALMGRV